MDNAYSNDYVEYLPSFKGNDNDEYSMTNNYGLKIYEVDFDTEDEAIEMEYQMRDNWGAFVETALDGKKLYIYPDSIEGERAIKHPSWFGDKAKLVENPEEIYNQFFMNESKVNESYSYVKPPQSQDELDDEAKEWLRNSASSVDIQRSEHNGEEDVEKVKKYFNSSRLCVKAAASAIQGKKDFYTLGKAGWGKTSIITDIALACGYDVITLYLDKTEAEVLGGLPTIEDQKYPSLKSTENTVPDWCKEIILHSPKIMKDKSRYYLLFLDEFNQASPAVMNALMPVIQRHVVAGRKMDNFFICAAGNLTEENQEGVHDQSIPLLSRWKGIKWDCNWVEAIKFMEQEYESIDGSKIYFDIMKREIDFVDPETDKRYHNYELFYSPRDIEKLLGFLATWREQNKKYGTVTTEDITDDVNYWLERSPLQNLDSYPHYEDDVDNLTFDLWQEYIQGYKKPESPKEIKVGDKKPKIVEWTDERKKNWAEGLIAGYIVRKDKETGKRLYQRATRDDLIYSINNTEIENKRNETFQTIIEMVRKMRGTIRFESPKDFMEAYPDFKTNPECVEKS